jgi:hypothetical protein
MIRTAHNGRPFIVMELLEGETLRDRISHGPLSIDEAIAVGAEIADALEAAHAKGILHRGVQAAARDRVRSTPSIPAAIRVAGSTWLFAPGVTRAVGVRSSHRWCGAAPSRTCDAGWNDESRWISIVRACRCDRGQSPEERRAEAGLGDEALQAAKGTGRMEPGRPC